MDHSPRQKFWRVANKKYRVFLSSVQKELETERVAVAGAVSSDAVLSRYTEIVLFENEPLSGRKMAKPYLDCLDSCDIYVLILDREYGHVQSTLSATHEEYRHAQYGDMPIMISFGASMIPVANRRLWIFSRKSRRTGTHTEDFTTALSYCRKSNMDWSGCSGRRTISISAKR